MDIIFEPRRGNPFCIEVGCFDTVLEIKEKVQKYQGVPVAWQTLIFNGQILHDERDIEYCELLHNSRVQLIITPDHANKPMVRLEEPCPSRKIRLNLQIPTSMTLVPIEMDVNDTVGRLREIIQETQNIQISSLVSHATGAELLDNYSIGEYDLTNNSEVNVILRPSPTGSGTSSGNSPNKLRLMVLPKCGTGKILVEVNASDKVSELRKELQRLHQQHLNFYLPPEGYFFIYKQNVMEDDRSFRWHKVNQGDTIEIFSGSVTGGL